MLGKVIRRVWVGCGIANVAVVGVSNLCNGGRELYEDMRYEWKRDADLHPYERVLGAVFTSIMLSVGMVGLTGVKCAGYFALGPIASYRIALAAHNHSVTGDASWTRVVSHPCNMFMRYHKYVMWPIGDASWRPQTLGAA